MKAVPRAELLPAGLAALAESGLLFAAFHDEVGLSVGATAGARTDFAVFTFVFVAGVLLATAYRTAPVTRFVVPMAAVGLGVFQGAAGKGSLAAIGTAVVLWLIAAFRVGMLAVRTWRDPVSLSFGLGATVLFIEILALPRSSPEGRLLPTIVAVFFVGSLASRAGSLWIGNRPAVAAARDRVARPVRNLVVLLALLSVVLGVTVSLGSPGGAFELSGGFVLNGVAWIILGMGFVVAEVLLRPLAWLFARLQLSDVFHRVAQHIQSARPPTEAGKPGLSQVDRIIGLVLFVTVVVVLLRAIPRRWRSLGGTEEPAPEPEPEPLRAPVGRRRRVRVPRIKRELPADTVRRWYAEALLALERLGLPKPPSRTPGEFLSTVRRWFPECAPGFTSLTRAYEEVRYGSVRLSKDSIGKLAVEREVAMRALSGARRIDDPDQA
ncbi:MAG: DUF4129 domain-containing protein [Actinobacteria bacterium]|nr:MAG: DUF4129 domain-containing protein [Actinomycetota bacterium]